MNTAPVESLRIGPEKNFCYAIMCPETKDVCLVDPAFEFDRVAKWVSRLTAPDKPQVRYLLATHGHWDHAGGFNEMLKFFPEARVAAHKNEKKRLAALHINLDVPLDDQSEILVGNLTIKVFASPGHTEGGACYLAGTQLLTGDTLFIDQCGRTDLAGGSDEDLFRSLQNIKSLNPHFIVRPGHDYGPKPFASLAEQIKTNPTLRVSTLEEFKALP